MCLNSALSYVCPLLPVVVYAASINQHTMGVQVAVAPDSPFEVSPIAKPCYTQPKEASCDIIKENKTNDYWIADQPGG